MPEAEYITIDWIKRARKLAPQNCLNYRPGEECSVGDYSTLRVFTPSGSRRSLSWWISVSENML